MGSPEGNKDADNSILRGTFTDEEIESLQRTWSRITAPARRKAERAENRRVQKQMAVEEVSRRKIEKAAVKAENRINEKRTGFCSCRGAGCACCGVLAVGTCALVTIAGPVAVRAIGEVIRAIAP